MTPAHSPARALAGLRRLGGGSGPTLAQVTDHLAERSTPLAVILMAGLAMVPSPGLPLGLITGLAIAWLGGAALWGRDGTLPGSLSRRTLPRPILDAALRRLVPLMRRVQRRTRPRLAPLVRGRGAALALAAGLLWRDGLGVLVGHALGVVSIGVIIGLGWSALALVT